MKISRLNRFIWLYLALTVIAGVAVSSTNFDGKGQNKTFQETCINSISGLSEYQKQRIVAMETQNRSVMNELQEKQQLAIGKTQKKEIRKQMDKQIESHGNEIKTLLSADQQNQFLQFQSYRSNQNLQGQKLGSGKGFGKGNGSGGGRGNGNKCRM